MDRATYAEVLVAIELDLSMSAQRGLASKGEILRIYDKAAHIVDFGADHGGRCFASGYRKLTIDRNQMRRWTTMTCSVSSRNETCMMSVTWSLQSRWIAREVNRCNSNFVDLPTHM